MTFTSFVYLVCFGWIGVCALLYVVELKLRTGIGRNADFVAFQRKFLIGYLPCLLADSLQAPYLYYLYQSYGFIEFQIAVIYVFGLVTGLVCSLFGWMLNHRFGPRLQSLMIVAFGCSGCLLKLFPHYGILLLSRVFDGIAAWLLSTAPQTWYWHHHIRSLELPPSWLSRTSRSVALAGGCLAIGAGFITEYSEDLTRLTPIPFIAAVPALLFGGMWIFRVWEEIPQSPEPSPAIGGVNVALGFAAGSAGASESMHLLPAAVVVASSSPKISRIFRKALKRLATQPILCLLAAVQSLFESVLAIFVFLWTPLFMNLKATLGTRPSLGLIYSCFMASGLAGTLLYKVVNRKLTTWSLLPISIAACFCSTAVAVMLVYPGGSGSLTSVTIRYETLLVCLCIYELGVGLYFPVIERVQKELLGREDRPAILGIFRVPLNVIACAGLLTLHDRDSRWGNWLLLTMSMVLLALSLLTAFLLTAIGRNRPVAELPIILNSGDSDDDEM